MKEPVSPIRFWAGIGWKITALVAKIAFGLYCLSVALDGNQTAGARAVAAAALVMIWVSVHAQEAKQRHGELLARLRALEKQ